MREGTSKKMWQVPDRMMPSILIILFPFILGSLQPQAGRVMYMRAPVPSTTAATSSTTLSTSAALTTSTGMYPFNFHEFLKYFKYYYFDFTIFFPQSLQRVQPEIRSYCCRTKARVLLQVSLEVALLQ